MVTNFSIRVVFLISLAFHPSFSFAGESECFAQQFPNLFPNSAELSERLRESLPITREMRGDKNLIIDDVYAFRINCDLFAQFIGTVEKDDDTTGPVSVVLTTQMEKGDRCVMNELKVAVTDMPDLPNRMEKWVHESLSELVDERLNGICPGRDR